MSEWIQGIKKIALNAIEETKPLCIRYGTVKAASPLMICLEQRLTLKKEQLILPAHMTDYTVGAVIDGEEKRIQIKNSLKAGEKVVLLRVQGGQSYVVIDRY